MLWLEVKNCHFSRTAGLAEFPDCVAARSAKHLGELETVAAGATARWCCSSSSARTAASFGAWPELDPAFAAALDQAAASGVEVLAYACGMGLEEIVLATPISWRRN